MDQSYSNLPENPLNTSDFDAAANVVVSNGTNRLALSAAQLLEVDGWFTRAAKDLQQKIGKDEPGLSVRQWGGLILQRYNELSENAARRLHEAKRKAKAETRIGNLKLTVDGFTQTEVSDGKNVIRQLVCSWTLLRQNSERIQKEARHAKFAELFGPSTEYGIHSL